MSPRRLRYINYVEVGGDNKNFSKSFHWKKKGVIQFCHTVWAMSVRRFYLFTTDCKKNSQHSVQIYKNVCIVIRQNYNIFSAPRTLTIKRQQKMCVVSDNCQIKPWLKANQKRFQSKQQQQLQPCSNPDQKYMSQPAGLQSVPADQHLWRLFRLRTVKAAVSFSICLI